MNIQKIIKKALIILIENDSHLIQKKVKEECINHRLACYLERAISKLKFKAYDYAVDLEYNKNYKGLDKSLIDENHNSKRIRPDIIIHNRETNTKNLVAFEIKKGYPSASDRKKIDGLLKEPYNYDYGCLISYLPDSDYIKVKLYSKSAQIEDFKVPKNK